MDPQLLAQTVMQWIMPYLAQAAEAAAQKAGAVAWEGAKALYEAVKKKLAGDEYAAETLRRAKEDPGVEHRQTALEGVLAEKISADAAFAAALQELLPSSDEVKPSGIRQEVTVRGKARVGSVQQIGSVQGNFNQGKRS